MKEEPKAAEGVHASAAPDIPPLQGTHIPVLVSSTEGPLEECPAGNTANPGASPLRSVAKSDYTSTSTKHQSSLPEIGQEYLQLERNLVPAAASELESPQSHTLLNLKEEETPGTEEQPTMSTPFDERSRMSERSERPMIGCSPFNPNGSQSTHGSSVGMGTPCLPRRQDAGSPRQSSEETSETELASLASLSRFSLALRTRQFVALRAAARESPGRVPGGQGQPEQGVQPCAVDPSYLLSTLAKTWLDATNVQPQSTLGMALSQCLGQITNHDEPSTSFLSVPGSQCREVPPNPNPTTGIQSEIVIPRAKAVAAVVSHSNNK